MVNHYKAARNKSYHIHIRVPFCKHFQLLYHTLQLQVLLLIKRMFALYLNFYILASSNDS